jgi:hypothetical protein
MKFMDLTTRLHPQIQNCFNYHNSYRTRSGFQTVADNLLKYLNEYGKCLSDKTYYKNKYLVMVKKANTVLVLKHQATKP